MWSDMKLAVVGREKERITFTQAVQQKSLIKNNWTREIGTYVLDGLGDGLEFKQHP